MAKTTTDAGTDKALVSRLLDGDPAAATEFFQRMDKTIAGACAIAFTDAENAEKARTEVAEITAANDFKLLGDYRGFAPLDSYVAILARDLLISSILRLIDRDQDRGWRAFERLYLKGRRQKLLSQHGADGDDIYQELFNYLSREDWRVLRNYEGKPGIQRLLHQKINSLAVDHHRESKGRFRTPKPIAAMPSLEQAVFRLLYREGLSPDAELVRDNLPSMVRLDLSIEDVTDAIDRVRKALPKNYRGQTIVESLDSEDAPELPSDEETPETVLILVEEEQTVKAALDELSAAVEALTDIERLYIALLLDGNRKPNQIARLLAVPVKDVYAMRPKLIGKLKHALKNQPATKLWQSEIRGAP